MRSLWAQSIFQLLLPLCFSVEKRANQRNGKNAIRKHKIHNLKQIQRFSVPRRFFRERDTYYSFGPSGDVADDGGRGEERTGPLKRGGGEAKPNTSFSMYTESFPREPLKVLNIHKVNWNVDREIQTANAPRLLRHLARVFFANYFVSLVKYTTRGHPL